MTREEFAKKWGWKYKGQVMFNMQAELLADLDSLSLPPAEGAEEINKMIGQTKDSISKRYNKNYWEILEDYHSNGRLTTNDFIDELLQDFATLHAQRIADKMVEKMSPSNEQIHEAALAWARDHSEAPDKDCPDWLIRDYEAGAYFVRQCYGCWNKTDKTVEERLREEYKRGIEDGKIIGKHGSVSFIE